MIKLFQSVFSMQPSDTDLIYSSPQSKVKDFCFDEQVVEVFPDMIQRSVPGYSTIIETIGKLSQKYVAENSNVYDLGCSLGAATITMRRNISSKNCHIYSVDNSPAMVERCKLHVNAFKSQTPCDVMLDDIISFEMKNASMIVLNFTLQFIDGDQRQSIVDRVYKALNPGGLFVISEKIVEDNQVTNDLLIDLHHDLKRANGYSELEIAQKRTALENVMKPDSQNSLIKKLHAAGFSNITPWFQCFNFTSIVAIK